MWKLGQLFGETGGQQSICTWSRNHSIPRQVSRNSGRFIRSSSTWSMKCQANKFQQTKSQGVSILYLSNTGFRLTSNNTIDGDIYRRCVASSVTQKINIRATQLLHLSQTRDPPVVLQLLLPVRLLVNPIRHGGSDEARGDAVDADAVLCPLHGERVGHVAHAGFRGSVWCRWHDLGVLSVWEAPAWLMPGIGVWVGFADLVWSVRGH